MIELEIITLPIKQSLDDHPITKHRSLDSARSVPLAVSLFERRAIVALVEVAIAVAVVVVVVAVTVALGPDRVEAVAVARVVAPGVESVAVADLRRIAADAARAV